MQFRAALVYTTSHTFIQLYGVQVFYFSKPLYPCFFTTSHARLDLAKN